MWETIFLITLLQVVSSSDLYFKVKEERPPPVFLGNIANITNLRKFDGKRIQDDLRYTFVSRVDNLDQKFNLDEVSGNLSTVEELDREETCSYQRDCVLKFDVAVQSMESAFFGLYSITIEIIDINDNGPEFSETSFEINVREDMKIGTSLSLPRALDKDGDPVFSSLSYEISPTNIPFDFVEVNHVPMLILVSELDRETNDSYKTTLTAIGYTTRSATLSISINVEDINDNYPVFQQKFYETRIPETILVNSTIIQILASDVDLGENNQIRYSLSLDNTQSLINYFQIRASSGGIYVNNILRSEGGKSFLVKVEACDSGITPLCTVVNVTIHITDTENDAPIIHSQLLFSKDGVASVKESSPFGRVIALVSVDDDDSGLNGESICSIEDEYFQIQKLQPNEYKVFLRRPLNRETLSKHEVFITCQDLGTPSLSSNTSFLVVVEDENDSEPVFERDIYTFNVKENSTIPTYIGKVTAIDKDTGDNGDIVYEIDTNEEFSINGTGHIFAITTLDFEWQPQIVFNILASDKGEKPLTATAAVIVNITDINDNPPVFEKSVFTFWILENEPVLFSPGCVSAKDKDSGVNGNLTFSSITAILPFVISQNGCLTLVEKVDYEKIKSYEFEIEASDNGVPVLKSSVFVVISLIDVNDNKPVVLFPVENNDTIVIGHKTMPRSEIAIVQAFDADSGENGKLLYSFLSQNGSDLFQIDVTSGHISTTRKIDQKDINIYDLKILISDLGTPKFHAQTILKVDIRELLEVDHGMETRFKNLKIVSVLVCVTILLSLSVMTILCLIRYMDRRRKEFKITSPSKRNEHHAHDQDNSTNPNSSYHSSAENNRYNSLPETCVGRVDYVNMEVSTVSRQNKLNDVIVSSRGQAVRQTPRQMKRPMKVYRRSKHTPQEDISCRNPDADEDIDLDTSVLDILRRHNQVVMSVRATKSQKREIAADLFYRQSSNFRDELGSDSGVGGSDVEATIHPVYTIPV